MQVKSSSSLNIRCILLCFQVVFAPKINFADLELVSVRDGEEPSALAKILVCRVAS